MKFTPGDRKTDNLLMTAVQSGNALVVREMIASGAGVNAHGSDGRTPLIHAAMAGGVEIVQLLLEAGAEIDEPAHHGSTALWQVGTNSRSIQN